MLEHNFQLGAQPRFLPGEVHLIFSVNAKCSLKMHIQFGNLKNSNIIFVTKNYKK